MKIVQTNGDGMKSIRIFTLMVLTIMIASFAGCIKNSPVSSDGRKLETVDNVVLGSYYGMCRGENCIAMFKLENDILYEDSLDIYPEFVNMPYAGNYHQIDQSLVAEMKQLINSMPRAMQESASGTIGGPDYRDQGGILLQLYIGGHYKYWLIDTNPGNVPDYLRDYIVQLSELITRLRAAS